MADIVERMRSRARFDTAVSPYGLLKEAADEIELLRKERDDYKADYFRRHKEAGDRMERALVAEARCDKLEKALEPVSSVAEAILAEAPIGATSVKLFENCEGDVFRVTLDQLRSVCAALAQDKRGGE